MGATEGRVQDPRIDGDLRPLQHQLGLRQSQPPEKTPEPEDEGADRLPRPLKSQPTSRKAESPHGIQYRGTLFAVAGGNFTGY